MRRRDILKLSAGAALTVPHVAQAQRERVLKFVPTPDLVVLDPVWGAFRTTHVHAHLVFDTLYGLDETFAARPHLLPMQSLLLYGSKKASAPHNRHSLRSLVQANSM